MLRSSPRAPAATATPLRAGYASKRDPPHRRSLEAPASPSRRIPLSPNPPLALAHRLGADVAFRPDLPKRGLYLFHSDRIVVRTVNGPEDEALQRHIICHELVHWTGAAHRLGRFGAAGPLTRFGRAYEEAVAEIGAAALMHELGLPQASPVREYVHGYLSQIAQPYGLVLRSARRSAAAAVAYLLDPARAIRTAA